MQTKVPWIVENGESAIGGGCMGCSSKEPQVHTIT